MTKGPPVFCRSCRLYPRKLRIARTEFKHIHQLDLIRPSTSSWVAPLQMARKNEADFRPFGDYRLLNTVTIDALILSLFPLPATNCAGFFVYQAWLQGFFLKSALYLRPIKPLLTLMKHQRWLSPHLLERLNSCLCRLVFVMQIALPKFHWCGCLWVRRSLRICWSSNCQ